MPLVAVWRALLVHRATPIHTPATIANPNINFATDQTSVVDSPVGDEFAGSEGDRFGVRLGFAVGVLVSTVSDSVEGGVGLSERSRGRIRPAATTRIPTVTRVVNEFEGADGRADTIGVDMISFRAGQGVVPDCSANRLNAESRSEWERHGNHGFVPPGRMGFLLLCNIRSMSWPAKARSGISARTLPDARSRIATSTLTAVSILPESDIS